MKIAIITGASSGMGKDFVEKVDDLNLDEIWGIALANEGLSEMFKHLKTKFVPFELDLTVEDNLLSFEKTLKEVSPSVEILVNCSGYGKFGRWDEIKLDSTLGMIDLNIKALVFLTQTVLPFMPDGARIVEFGSVAGFQPVPYISVYSATKAFVVSYSRALRQELKWRNISLTCVCPFWTKTQFFKRAVNKENDVIKKYIVMYDSKKVVNKAFIDMMKRKEMSVYGFVSKFQMLLTKILPHKLVIKIWCLQQNFKKTYKNKK